MVQEGRKPKTGDGTKKIIELRVSCYGLRGIKQLLIIEPQNTEQGMSNFEVFFLTSAVRYSLFDIRYSKHLPRATRNLHPATRIPQPVTPIHL